MGEGDVDTAAGAAVGADAQVEDPSGAEGTGDFDGAVDCGTTVPGGGDATASGSSISSSGKSGSCSSKGEIGTPAKPFGTAGFADASVATSSRGVSEKSVDGPVSLEVPVATVPVPAALEAAIVDPAAPKPVAPEPVAPEAAAAVGLVAAAGPVAAGFVPAVPARAGLPEPAADGFVASELPPAETPIGFMVFFVPVVAASLIGALGNGALREAAPAAAADTFAFRAAALSVEIGRAHV